MFAVRTYLFLHPSLSNNAIKYADELIITFSDLGEEFRAEPTDLEADEGFTTILPCGPPEGYPRPMVTWKRDGEYVNLDQRIHISEESGNLIIQRLFKEDEGHYQCIVSNMAGSRDSSVAKLHVRRKFYTHIYK